jgi:hypothetical protein
MINPRIRATMRMRESDPEIDQAMKVTVTVSVFWTAKRTEAMTRARIRIVFITFMEGLLFGRRYKTEVFSIS